MRTLFGSREPDDDDGPAPAWLDYWAAERDARARLGLASTEPAAALLHLRLLRETPDQRQERLKRLMLGIPDLTEQGLTWLQFYRWLAHRGRLDDDLVHVPWPDEPPSGPAD